MKRETLESGTDHFSDEKISDVVQSLKVHWALQEVLHVGLQSDQLVCGVHKAANELAIDEGTIGLCVLVENPNTDPGIQVHCRLIGAYCWECAIPVIKVNSSRKLCQMVRYHGPPQEPLHCIFIKNIDQQTESVATLLKFARHVPARVLKIT